MKTPSIAKIDAILLADGYRVARIESEKFWIDKKAGIPKFHAIIWLALEPKAPDHNAEKNSPEAGK